MCREWNLEAWDGDGTTFGAVTAVHVAVTHDTIALTTSQRAVAQVRRPAAWQPAGRCQLLVMAALPSDIDPVQALLDRTYDGLAYLGDLAVTFLA